jgi:hypothetical protein
VPRAELGPQQRGAPPGAGLPQGLLREATCRCRRDPTLIPQLWDRGTSAAPTSSVHSKGANVMDCALVSSQSALLPLLRFVQVGASYTVGTGEEHRGESLAKKL